VALTAWQALVEIGKLGAHQRVLIHAGSGGAAGEANDHHSWSGGSIGSELVKLLAAANQPFRVVGRNPKTTAGAAETLAADG
jgi:hypothetical protein